MYGADNPPVGEPSFDLAGDQVETALALICEGIEEGQPELRAPALEVPLSHILAKAMRRVKSRRPFTNIGIHTEHEILDMTSRDAGILGRIDIVFKFGHHYDEVK